MKKILTMTFFSILCAGMLSGCGTDYDTADSTVFAFKDGSIVSTDVENLIRAHTIKMTLKNMSIVRLIVTINQMMEM